MDKDVQDYIDKKVGELKQEFQPHIERLYSNERKLGENDVRVEKDQQEWARNWSQHSEFYKKFEEVESENDKVTGGLKVVGILLVPIIISIIATTIRMFIG